MLCPFWRRVADRLSSNGVRWLELSIDVLVLPKLEPLLWLLLGDSQVTIMLFGDESPLPPRLLLSIDFFTGDSAGDICLLITSSVNLGDSWSLGTIFTSVGFAGGDLLAGFSPKYGHVHGGGNGNDTFSVASDLLQLLSSSKMSEDRRFSWKLKRFLHLGDGDSSRKSPSWKVAALLRFEDHGDTSVEGTGEVVPEKLSELLSDLRES